MLPPTTRSPGQIAKVLPEKVSGMVKFSVYARRAFLPADPDNDTFASYVEDPGPKKLPAIDISALMFHTVVLFCDVLIE
jgi:hypothetical protein